MDYHSCHPAGKLEIHPTKKMDTDWQLSLAYSPGVAAPCNEIARSPEKAFDYTGKGNLIAVVSNGSAVLGLGEYRPLGRKTRYGGQGGFV